VTTGAKKLESMLGDQDLHLFNEGTHFRLHDKLGAHLGMRGGVHGAFFAVWAPDAESVSVIGDWNGWDPTAHPLRPRGRSGVLEGFAPGVRRGALYKLRVVSRESGRVVDKADPFAFAAEPPPGNASIVWDLDYVWSDEPWMRGRKARNALSAPMSIYEVHLGSWRRDPGDDARLLGYREIAPRLAEYASWMGFTHVELLPVMEHPFYGSWGYQTSGYFAPTCRYGSPQDFMFLVDTLHRSGLGVILDWVPSHFVTDEHGLGRFDGTHLYEHADPRQGKHEEWGSYVFNYGRNEVRSFLISSAVFWADRYHVDGFRLDAVASMLYLDYNRREGEWVPNRHGGRENLEAVAFLRQLNETIYAVHPDIQTIAEESTSWPGVSRPTYLGGLGAGLKWDMGWMHDTLRYMSKDPIHRRHHHNDLTFRGLYAFTESFVLPLSHDEVVHGKGSLYGKMPGDAWRKRANLRLLFALMFAHPGKKLLFMGGEFGQEREWGHDRALDWDLSLTPEHGGIRDLVRDLNRAYAAEPALHELDCDAAGFEWVDCGASDVSTLSLLRKGRSPDTLILIVLNFTPVPRESYRIGAPRMGRWREIINSDARVYGGSGQGNMGGVEAAPVPFHGRPCSVNPNLPPLGALFLKWEGAGS